MSDAVRSEDVCNRTITITINGKDYYFILRDALRIYAWAYFPDTEKVLEVFNKFFKTKHQSKDLPFLGLAPTWDRYQKIYSDLNLPNLGDGFIFDKINNLVCTDYELSEFREKLQKNPDLQQYIDELN
jgi:hypothetical protein